MYQLFSLAVVDWLMPNPEKDTPLRWIARLALIIGVALAVTSFH